MTARASLDGASGRLRLGGVLNFDTVPALAKQAARELAAVQHATVDCAEVTSCNSAGLALLLEMSRIMRARLCTVRFLAIPEQVSRMAVAYGLSSQHESLEQILHSQGPKRRKRRR